MTARKNFMILGLAATLGLPAAMIADDDVQKRVVRKIEIHCDGEDCGKHGHGEHSFSWVAGDGPGRIMLGTHLGGGFLGVQLAELTPDLRTHFGVDPAAGVMVSEVVDGSPAARAGIRVGDIITAIDREAIASGRELARHVRVKEDGETVLVELWRDGSMQHLTATLVEREGEPILHRHFFTTCEGDDCDERRFVSGSRAFDCEGAEPCEVRVECDENGDCECIVNGEPTDCAAIHHDKR